GKSRHRRCAGRRVRRDFVRCRFHHAAAPPSHTYRITQSSSPLVESDCRRLSEVVVGRGAALSRAYAREYCALVVSRKQPLVILRAAPFAARRISTSAQPRRKNKRYPDHFAGIAAGAMSGTLFLRMASLSAGTSFERTSRHFTSWASSR